MGVLQVPVPVGGPVRQTTVERQECRQPACLDRGGRHDNEVAVALVVRDAQRERLLQVDPDKVVIDNSASAVDDLG
jgi:hypothetical protein